MVPTLAVGIRAQAQSPIEDETRTAERPSEQLALARRRVAAVPVGAFLEHTDLFFLSPAKPETERRARLLPIPSTGWVFAAQKLYDTMMPRLQRRAYVLPCA
jgi:hypothetical protein